MTKIYHCSTGNYLPRTKRFFNSTQECSNHIEKIIALKKPWVKEKQVKKSYYFTVIDTDLLPEYERIFKVFEGIIENDMPEPRKKKKIKDEPISRPIDEKTA